MRRPSLSTCLVIAGLGILGTAIGCKQKVSDRRTGDLFNTPTLSSAESTQAAASQGTPPPPLAAALTLVGPDRATVDTCSAAIQVTNVDDSGNAAATAADLPLSFAGLGGAQFYSDQACTVAESAPVLPHGQSEMTLYLMDAQAETLKIAVVVSGLSSQTLAVSVAAK